MRFTMAKVSVDLPDIEVNKNETYCFTVTYKI